MGRPRILNVTREPETGDIVAQSNVPMTVKTLIEALSVMPDDALVLRYCDWAVTAVVCEGSGDKVEIR